MKKFSTILAVVFLSTFLVAGSAMALMLPVGDFQGDILYNIGTDTVSSNDVQITKVQYEDLSFSTTEAVIGAILDMSLSGWSYSLSNTPTYLNIAVGTENAFTISEGATTYMSGILYNYNVSAINGSPENMLITAAMKNLVFDMTAGSRFIEEFSSYTNGEILSLVAQTAYVEASDTVSIDVSGKLAPVPEPATMLLLGAGLIGLAGASRKKLFKK